MQELIAGGVAGATAKSCVAPLERCKILFQTGKLHGGSVVSTLTAIVRSEGAAGLFRGNGASVLRIVPYSAVHFGLYEQYRRLLVERLYAGSSHLSVSPVMDLLAGSGAGATAVLATYPLDLVRTRLAFVTEARGVGRQGGGSSAAEPPSSSSNGVGQPRGRSSRRGSRRAASVPQSTGQSGASIRSSSSVATQRRIDRHAPPPSCVRQQARRALHLGGPADPRHSIRGVLASTLKHEGLRGLYHGIGPSMYGILPYAGLKFYVYQSMKQAYLRGHPSPGAGAALAPAPASRLPVPAMLGFGALAGVAAQTVTYPLDVVRRRMQVEGLKHHGASAAAAAAHFAEDRLPQSTPAALVAIGRLQGWRTLYAGLSINYMKVVPSTAIGFAIYDYLKAALDLPTHL